jgi:DNA-binding MarR family transcriptional regulator
MTADARSGGDGAAYNFSAAATVRRRFRQAMVVMNRALAASELSIVQYHLLLELAAAGSRGSAQFQLARWLSVPEPRVSVLVSGLVQRGLVRRETPRGDRRQVRVAATPSGRRLVYRASERQRRSLVALIRGIPREELTAMIEWGSGEYLGLGRDSAS